MKRSTDDSVNHAVSDQVLTTRTAIRRLQRQVNFLETLRTAAVAVTIAALWYALVPTLNDTILYLAAAIWALLQLMNIRSRESTSPSGDFGLFMDISFPGATGNPYAPDANETWQRHLHDACRAILKEHRTRRGKRLMSAVIYCAVAAFAMGISNPPLQAVFDDVQSVVSNLQKGASLRVLEGAASQAPAQTIFLKGSETLDLRLLADNMVEITARMPSGSAVPVIELWKPGQEPDGETGGLIQNFQMLRKSSDENAPGLDTYALSFTVTQSAGVVIPSLFGNEVAARISVEKLPVPEAALEIIGETRDPWPDNLPLPLKVSASGQNPLRMVSLVITSGKRQSKELVNNIVAQDMHAFAADYDLLLEPYNDEDMAEIQVMAEVIDRSLPKPLVGYSEPITLTVASAYGRYRQTLSTLKEIKAALDEKLEAGQAQLSQEISQQAAKAQEQAADSPFFDGIDRMQIAEFGDQLNQLTQQESFETMAELSENLNFFLFEHEILDDRERDRDFFVAARSLSRLLENPEDPGDRVSQANERLLEFLDERAVRWKMRLEHLSPEYHPPRAEKIISARPFHAAIETVGSNWKKGAKSGRDDALRELSETVSQYKSWIDDLEASEDRARTEEAAKRQEGLAATQDALRDLQRRQARISQNLDKAAEQAPETLADNWSMTRMEQNANIEGTAKVEAAMRSLSALASRRIKAAMNEMEKARDAGNESKFEGAETASDQAGRLLNQAQNAAQQAQRQQGQRGRRRRVTGDNYYGQGVITGDIEIKRTYEVDERYREDILRDVTSSQYIDDEQNREYLNQYLRRVVR